MIVYKHTRLDENVPFYIGIGESIKRAYKKDGRNPIWNKITSKTEYKVDILFENLTRECAINKEIELIEKYGRICNSTGTLANITVGGDCLFGELNPMYNKGKLIEIEGVVINGIFQASRCLNVHHKTISYRLKSKNFPAYRRLGGIIIDPKYSDDEIKAIMYNKKRGLNNPMYGKKRPQWIIDKLTISVRNRKFTKEEIIRRTINKKNRCELIIEKDQIKTNCFSMAHAANIIGVKQQSIGKALKNKTKSCGYIISVNTETFFKKEILLKNIDLFDNNNYPNPKMVEMLKSL